MTVLKQLTTETNNMLDRVIDVLKRKRPLYDAEIEYLESDGNQYNLYGRISDLT